MKKNRLDKLDRTKIVAQTAAEAARPQRIPRKDRLSAAYILSLRAYGLDPYVKHPIDKTVLSMRKRPLPPAAKV